MAKVLVDDASLYATANAIRAQLDVQTTYLPSEMAAAIASIEGGGGGGSADYQLVEYIESDGTQAINTGVQFAQGSAIVLDAIVLSVVSSQNFTYLVGASGTNGYVGIRTTTSGNIEAILSQTSKTIGASGSNGYRHVYYIYGSNVGSSAGYWDILTSYGSSVTLAAFGYHASAFSHYSKMKLYSLRVGDHVFLPCKRLSDGAYGLIDTYDGSFHGDVMSGNAFTAGSVIGDYQPAASS